MTFIRSIRILSPTPLTSSMSHAESPGKRRPNRETEETCQNMQWRLVGGLQTPEHNPEHAACNLNAVFSTHTHTHTHTHKLSSNTVKWQNSTKFELFESLLAKLSCLNSYVLLLSIPKRNHYSIYPKNWMPCPHIQSHSTIFKLFNWCWFLIYWWLLYIRYIYITVMVSNIHLAVNQGAFASKGHIRKQRSKLPVNSCCDCQSTSIHLGSWKISSHGLK